MNRSRSLLQSTSRSSSVKGGSVRDSVQSAAPHAHTHDGDHADADPKAAGAETDAGLPTFERERALVLKFDVRILPILALMYLANALDKGNLGNAKTNGMETDLHFEDGQYNTILSVFFVPNMIQYIGYTIPVAQMKRWLFWIVREF